MLDDFQKTFRNVDPTEFTHMLYRPDKTPYVGVLVDLEEDRLVTEYSTALVMAESLLGYRFLIVPAINSSLSHAALCHIGQNEFS